MKIIDFKTYAVYANYRNWVFVKIFTDEGIHGVGEATIEWKTNAVLGAFQDLKPYVIGNDPRDFEWHFFDTFRELYWRLDPVTLSAIAAIEMAMFDVTGKYYDIPCYRLLGGKMRDNIKIYGNGWFSGSKTIEDFAKKAKKAVDKGITALKWDPFGDAYWTISRESLDNVLEIIGTVREVVGSKVDLMIEGHGRFNVRTALDIAKEIEQFNPFYFEEPVTPDVVDDTVEVRKRTRIPIATGERLFTKYMYREILEKKGADYIQPDVVHVGGLLELKKIAAMAEAYNVHVAPHNPNGPIATAANLQLCACIPNVTVLEMLLNDVPWRSEVTNETYDIEDGHIKIPNSPGLGIDIDESEIYKYPMKFTPQNMFDGNLYREYGDDKKDYYGGKV